MLFEFLKQFLKIAFTNCITITIIFAHVALQEIYFVGAYRKSRISSNRMASKNEIK